MSRHQRTYDEALSRALHAAADQIEPSGDGLERIRARLGPPMPAPAAWMSTSYQRALGQLLGRATSLGAWLEAIVGQIADRYRPGARDADGPQSLRWLRPAGAAATAAVIVIMGVFALRAIPQAISAGAFNQSVKQGGQQNGQGGQQGADGNGSSLSGSPLPGGLPGGPVPLSSRSSCSPSSPSLGPPPNQVSPFPTASGSPSPSSPGATPSSPGGTPSPSQSASPTPSGSPAGTQASPSIAPAGTAGAADQTPAAGSQQAASQPHGHAGTQTRSVRKPRHSPTPTPSCGG